MHAQKEKPPEEVPAIVPKLGKKSIEERYNISVSAYLKETEPQLKKDAGALNKEINKALRTAGPSGAERTKALWNTVDGFLEENPDSPLNYYTEDDMIHLSGKKTGTVNVDAIKEGIRSYLLGPKKGKKRETSEFKKLFTNTIIKSGEKQVKAGGAAYKDESLDVEDAPLYVDFSLFFAKHTGVGHETEKLTKNKLPVVITYNEDKEKIIFSYPESMRKTEMELE